MGYPIICYINEELIFEEYLDEPYDKNKVKQVLYRYFRDKSGKSLPWGILTGIRPVKISLRLKESGKSDAEIYDILKDEYYCEEDKITLLLEVSNREYHLTKELDHKNCYALYIAIPFCPTRMAAA